MATKTSSPVTLGIARSKTTMFGSPLSELLEGDCAVWRFAHFIAFEAESHRR